MSFPLMLLASYGLCFGLMNEKVPGLNATLSRLPVWRKDGQNLFQRGLACSYCTGFHTGWIVWVFVRVVCDLDSPTGELALFAFASSAFCYSLDTALRWLEG